jgi:hypothetical protein
VYLFEGLSFGGSRRREEKIRDMMKVREETRR